MGCVMNGQLGFGVESVDEKSLNSIAFGANSQIILFFNENRKVIYSNPAAADFFDSEDNEGISARFEELQNQKQPDGQNSFEHFSQWFDEAEKQGFAVFETVIEKHGRELYFSAAVRSVEYGEKRLLMVSGNDVTALKESEKRLEKQTRQINVLNYVGELLLSADYEDFSYAMKDVVEHIGRAFEAAHTTLCKLEPGGDCEHCVVLYSWDAGEPTVCGARLPESWVNELKDGKVIAASLSEVAGEEAGFMRSHGLLSAVLVPVITEMDNDFIGLFFDDCERAFGAVAINALVGIANLLATGFIRNQSTGMLMDAVNTNRVLLDANPFNSIIIDENGYIIDCNKSARDFFRLHNSRNLEADFYKSVNEYLPEFQPDGRRSIPVSERLKTMFEAGYNEFDTLMIVDGKQRFFNIIMKKVVYKNVDVAAVFMFDLTAQKEVQHALEYNNRLLKALGNVANMLLTTDATDLETTMNQALGIIGRATELDRVYVWKNIDGEDGRVYTTQLYEWSPDADPQQGGELAVDIPLDDTMPNWRETVLKGKCINAVVKESSPQMQAQLAPQGIVSLLIVPIFMQSKFWGFIGLDDCVNERIFSDVEENFMRICGFMVMTMCDAIQNELSMQLLYEREQALISAQIKTNFLANMSHEIRTPMNAILGMIELIMHENITDTVLSYSVDIRNACRGLLSIINDILDISKIESGRLEITPTTYHVSSLLADVIGIVKLRAEKKMITFAVNIDPNIPSELIGDELRIKQVLINLLNNAIKFTHEGQITLSISSRLEGGRCRLIASVEDTGIGIKTEDMEKIFILFQQVDTKKNRNIEGTGLGLSISKQLVEMMEGHIEVKSEYGVGSTFTVSVMQPISDNRPVTELKAPDDVYVLVYENRPAYLSSLTYTLDSLGCRYEVCVNRSEINHYLEDYKFNYIFVSSLHINKIQALAASKQPQAVIIALQSDGNDYSNHISISMPIHCMQIANILNDEYDRYDYRNDVLNNASIIAPDAKVLVVDDNAVNLRVAAGLLSIFKIRADTAISGMRAIEMVQEKDYDLVFMDHMMPDMDGIDTTVAIRAMGEKYHSLPIIALTANAIGGVREMFKVEGLDDFLAKPVELTKLNAMLKKWIPKDKQTKSVQLAPTGESGIIISGVDTQTGIVNSGGTPEAYNEILAIYAADCENRLIDMTNYHKAGDVKALTICIHAVKSASANIGAGEVSAKAAELETAGKGNDSGFINQNLLEFFDALSALIARIQGYLEATRMEDTARDKPADDGLLKASLDTIEKAMDNLDIDAAENALKALYSYDWDEDITGQIRRISECIGIFDYDGIAAAILKLKHISGVELGKERS